MICIDSWIWLEYVFEGEAWEAAEAAIERADTADRGGIVPATVIAEVSYRIRVERDAATAAEAIDAIRSFDHIDILPVTDDIAEYGAALRERYYERGDRALSYADAIHLAMAAAVAECEALYTGDPDFEGVEEVETVVI